MEGKKEDRMTGGMRIPVAETWNAWNSLGGRLIVSFSAFVMVMTMFLTIPPYVYVKKTLEAELEKRGEAHLRKLSPQVAAQLLRGDHSPLQDLLVNEALPEVSDLAFVAVTDEKGKVLHHSDTSRIGKPWAGASAEPSDAPLPRTGRNLVDRGERRLEISAPVESGGKKLGTLVVGMSYRGMDELLARLLRILGGVAVLVLGASLLFTRPFITRIVSGITRLGRMTREIARGELRQQIPEEGFEEIRALARDFNVMAENLRTILRQIQESGAGVGSFSSNIMTVIQEQAASASQHATSVAEVTATMEELSRTSRQIAQNAESVKEAAARSVEVAQHGTTLGREGVEAMVQIKERVGDIARKTLFLGEKSHEIGKVMEIIKEIASEIHLLALNAAIESAAAGEHGRRFAVVASEVRRLAEKTRESTETIRGIITEIQAATNSSVEATEQGTREVERWKETIQKASDAFSEIIQTIERTSEASTQISLATHQQTSANEQVVQAMRQIAEMVRVTATHMKQSSASAVDLQAMAAMLQEKVAVFQV